MGDALGRRKLFSELLGQVARAAASAAPDAGPAPQLRPPGALPEAAFLAACTRCDRCVGACPQQAVFRFTEDAGVLAGTPVMLPEERACAMCDGFPCAAACQDGALVMPATPLVRLGSVRILEATCIAFAGPECGACAGLCPGDSAALSMARFRPRVDAARCVGCGLCIAACPVRPAAIAFDPPGTEHSG